jgi:hypothetical protein
MTEEEANIILEPLFRRAPKGHVVPRYDSHGEMVFNGVNGPWVHWGDHLDTVEELLYQIARKDEALRDVLAHRRADKDGNYVMWVGETCFHLCEAALHAEEGEVSAQENVACPQIEVAENEGMPYTLAVSKECADKMKAAYPDDIRDATLEEMQKAGWVTDPYYYPGKMYPTPNGPFKTT